MIKLTDDLKKRFNRNIILPQVGEEGQKKLLGASVLVAGCGGLGSASLTYLAAAGIGRLGLVDFDRVDVSNLQRQVIHDVHSIGEYKTESASRRIKALFPEITTELFTLKLDSSNILEIFNDFDIIVDATDNFPARYLMNHAAHLAGKPIVMGAVFGFSGQATTVIPGRSACYCCLFSDYPPASFLSPGEVPGIMGTSPGIIGMIQATEVVKLILETGSILENRLLLYDGLDMRIHPLKYGKNPDCPVCGVNPTDDLTLWNDSLEVQ